MSDCQDMTTALARELTQGIEGEVEDLGAVFKRMALLKPVVDVIPGDADAVSDVSAENMIADSISDVTMDNAITSAIATPNPTTSTTGTAAQLIKEREISKRPTQSSGLLSLLHKPRPKTKATTKKKTAAVHENQMSLFDLMDSSA